MSLIPVTDRSTSEAAFRTLKKRLTEGCRKFTRLLGWQGGHYKTEVYWNPRERFWSTFSTAGNNKRFWCAYGVRDPEQRPVLSITLECNPPIKGVNRRCAGAFLTDGSKVFIAHSGKIGGGREGIGKTAFVDSYPLGNWQPIQWPDGYQNMMIVLGRIDGKELPRELGAFVREVSKFKKRVKSDERAPSDPLAASFSPEFTGKRRKYHISGDIESSCDHGFIVNELEKCVRKIGFGRTGKDQPRDLLILSKSNRVEVLFEVKPEITTTSVYQGIGQLLYHSANDGRPPRRVFVLPERPKAKTQAVLDKLNIEVLTFRWNGSTPVFHNLKGLLK